MAGCHVLYQLLVLGPGSLSWQQTAVASEVVIGNGWQTGIHGPPCLPSYAAGTQNPKEHPVYNP